MAPPSKPGHQQQRAATGGGSACVRARARHSWQEHAPVFQAHLEQVTVHEQRAAQAQLARSLEPHGHDLRPGPGHTRGKCCTDGLHTGGQRSQGSTDGGLQEVSARGGTEGGVQEASAHMAALMGRTQEASAHRAALMGRTRQHLERER